MADTTTAPVVESTGLTAAVEAAAAQLETQLDEPEVQVEETPESDDEPEIEETTDEEKTQAINLYKALKGPQAGAILAALAQQAGLLGNNTPETKSEVREAKKEIKTILEEALGSEYKFLSDKLEKGLTQIFEQEREEQAQNLAQIHARQVEREVVEVTTQLNTESKGEYAKFEARIAELTKEIPAGDMNIKTYLNRLYAIAKSEGTKTTTKQTTDRINRTRTDAPSRLRTTSAPSGRETVIPDKKMNLNDSIKFALDELSKQK